MNKIEVIRNTKAASKEDLYITLAYFQDALDIAQALKKKIDNMPLVVRAVLEDRGADLEAGSRAEFIFLQSINYLEQLMECFEEEAP
jgi:hypothetical protein